MNKLGRYRLISDRKSGADYMHRYYLFLKDRTWFPFNFALHKIVRSDDPIFHDHPWSYLTIILKGGYWEHLPVFNSAGEKIAEFAKWRGAGSVIWHRATDMHWLELEEENPATTLVCMGPQRREWGFLVQVKQKKHRWVRYDYYLNNWTSYHEKYIVPKFKQTRKKK